VLHALLLTPAFLGSAPHKRHSPNNETLGASASLSEESTMTLLFIEQSNAGSKADPDTDYVASLSLSPSALRPVAMRDFPPPTALGQGDSQQDEEATANEAATSDPGNALFGRYVGQIDARIQRAWIRPRTSIDSGTFTCRVQIAQEPSGRVKEIEIVRCNGDIPWQTSLIRAIQSASPLPAPPDPKLFTHTFTLEFTARPFTPGENPEGFEPESRSAMQ